MKITCQSCQAKYTIADEKVAGKTVKIKCKKCGATIVVNGTETGAVAAPAAAQIAAPAAAVASAPPGDDDEGEGATRVFAEGAGPGGAEWTVNVTDEDQRTMNAAQIAVEYQRGVVNDDTYVWKDGMADWLPISGVAELMAMMRVAAPPPAAGAPAHMPVQMPVQMPAHAPEPAAGLGGTMMMAETPFAPSPVAPQAARRKAPAGGVDLFAPGKPAEAAPAAASHSTATASLDRMVGERNENSVRFSISALTAAAAATRKGEEALLDLAAPSPGPRNGGRAPMDDLINLGGGMVGPVLAPPPLLAPVVEAPPAPMPMQMQMPMQAMGAPGMSVPDYPQKKSKTGLIIGLIAGVAVLAGVGVFVVMSGGDKPAGTDAATSAATPETAVAANTTPPPATTPAQPATADTGATQPASSGTPAAVSATPTSAPVAAANRPNTGPGPGRNDPKPDPKPDTKPDPKPDTKPDPKPDAKPDPKPDAKPDQGGGGKEFDRGAALSALSGGAGGARSCKTADGPTGSGRVKVTFAPSGNVTSVTLESGPFGGTSMAGCIIGAFRGAHVPAFDGAPVSVSKSFSIN